jgi:hypothetical protein
MGRHSPGASRSSNARHEVCGVGIGFHSIGYWFWVSCCRSFSPCHALLCRENVDNIFEILVQPHNRPPTPAHCQLPTPRPNLFCFLRSWIALSLKLRSGSIDCHSGAQLHNGRYSEDIYFQYFFELQTHCLNRAIMPVVRTLDDDGRSIEAPQFALDKGYTGEFSFMRCFCIRSDAA